MNIDMEFTIHKDEIVELFKFIKVSERTGTISDELILTIGKLIGFFVMVIA
ncbi:MAG: hypothetical protein FWD23_15440 [Oscillospiraceae bacterium]|nr:hypothetical protein [Oscillospiraceae bacterium]